METMRRIAAVGVAVASDMLGMTLSGLIYTPFAYAVMHALAEHRESCTRHRVGEP